MIWFDADTLCLIEIDFTFLIPVKVDASVNDPMRITYDDDSKGSALLKSGATYSALCDACDLTQEIIPASHPRGKSSPLITTKTVCPIVQGAHCGVCATDFSET